MPGFELKQSGSRLHVFIHNFFSLGLIFNYAYFKIFSTVNLYDFYYNPSDFRCVIGNIKDYSISEAGRLFPTVIYFSPKCVFSLKKMLSTQIVSRDI